MRFPLLVSVSVLAASTTAGSSVSLAAAGQAQAKPATASPKAAARPAAPAKTPWGDPDLQGTWTNIDVGVPFERPKEYGTREFLTDDEFAIRKQARSKNSENVEGLGNKTIYFPSTDKGQLEEQEQASKNGVSNAGPEFWYEWFGQESRRTSTVIDPPDGRIPEMTEEGKKIRTRSAGIGAPGGPEDFNLWDRCITRGLPNAMVPTVYNNAYRILQAPGYVVIFYELFSKARIIPLDGRPHIPNAIQQWDGDARGHWEGNTLVVDVTNFSDKIRGAVSNPPAPVGYKGTGHTLHLTERFTRLSANVVRYEATIDDPVHYTKPWTVAEDLGRDEKYQLFEYACHEGNYAVPNALSGSRAEEKAAAEAAREKK